MSNKMGDSYKLIINIVVIILLVAVGFFLGRCSSNETVKTTIEYVTLPPIHDTIKVSEPYRIEIPQDPIYITRTDTLHDTLKEVIDTSAILKDWIERRYYSQILIDSDTIGKVTVDCQIQYNKLDSLGYEFIPIQKSTKIEKIKTRIWEPFIMIGYNTDNYGVAQAGIFIKGFGISYQFGYKLSGENKMTHAVNIGYKF